ncbi:MAG: hypothetical protein A4S14_05845 [Proteobacteria bacterium SG_bin9]|nr:MAG: hypothetical protein A4S14_05845 [Proteobacteria bacterium SG_bin9]
MAHTGTTLVTGAAGQVGSVGRQLVALLRQQAMPVRALVRKEDQRSAHLAEMGAEIVVADLTRPDQVYAAMKGCTQAFFATSIGPSFLECALATTAAARECGLEMLVNLSQMTTSQMRIDAMTDSPQQRQGWLTENAMNWSGVRVVHVRATIFMQAFFLRWAAMSISRDDTLRFPFGDGKTSPIASQDVAQAIFEILDSDPLPAGTIFELTGPQSIDMSDMALEYGAALNRPIAYVDIPHDQWVASFVDPLPISPHLKEHLIAMAHLHKANRYDRFTNDFEQLTGRKPQRIRDFVRENAAAFARKPTVHSGRA